MARITHISTLAILHQIAFIHTLARKSLLISMRPFPTWHHTMGFLFLNTWKSTNQNICMNFLASILRLRRSREPKVVNTFESFVYSQIIFTVCQLSREQTLACCWVSCWLAKKRMCTQILEFLDIWWFQTALQTLSQSSIGMELRRSSLQAIQR